MKIKDLNADERPRELMLKSGAQNLSGAQLLAILLRTGSRSKNVLDVARDLLYSAEGSLNILSDMSLEKMCEVKGIGMDKAVTVAAAFELGRRLNCERDDGKVMITCASKAIRVLRPLFSSMETEELWCLFLKRWRRIISSERISSGGETLTEVNIKKIVRRSLDLKASAVILSHNHPSGNPKPSEADLKMTRKVKQALETFEIMLMDHIIVTEDDYFSFNDEN